MCAGNTALSQTVILPSVPDLVKKTKIQMMKYCFDDVGMKDTYWLAFQKKPYHSQRGQGRLPGETSLEGRRYSASSEGRFSRTENTAFAKAAGCPFQQGPSLASRSLLPVAPRLGAFPVLQSTAQRKALHVDEDLFIWW